MGGEPRHHEAEPVAITDGEPTPEAPFLALDRHVPAEFHCVGASDPHCLACRPAANKGMGAAIIEAQAKLRMHRNRALKAFHDANDVRRSEEHTSELQSLMRISYAVFCLKKKKIKTNLTRINIITSILTAANT